MQRVKLTLAYNGSNYAGWQLQAKKNKKPTLQGALENALFRLAGRRIVVHASGRTDAGVHAEAQVCHFDPPLERLSLDWYTVLNSILPEDIKIIKAELVSRDFHSRKSALSKNYAYTLWSGSSKAMPALAPYCWATPELDFDKMQEAALKLVGTRDFAVFQNSGSVVKSTVRTINSIEFKKGESGGGLICPEHWPVRTCFVQGDGFLRQMVRNIMGFLVWIGQGKLDLKDVETILASGSRANLPSPTAPARALTLVEVFY